MRSPQEILVEKIWRSSLGAPFVFIPDLWEKGDTTKRAKQWVDLAWQADDCVILMFMQEKTKKPLATDDRHRADSLQVVEHNFRQAQKALRFWRDLKKDLRGSNEFNTFAISACDVAHVVILSIAQSAASTCSYDADRAKRLSVSACASIPQSILELIAEVGASALDLLAFILSLEGKAEMSEADGLAYAKRCIQESRLQAHSEWPKAVEIAHSPEIFKGLMTLRSVSSSSPTFFYNDIGFEDLHRLTGCLATLLQQCEQSQGAVVSCYLRLGHYDPCCIVGAVMGETGIVLLNNAIEDHQRRSARGELRSGSPVIVIDSRLPAPIFVTPPCDRPRHFRAILDAKHELGSGPSA